MKGLFVAVGTDVCLVNVVLVVIVVVANSELVTGSIENLEGKESHTGTATPLPRRSPAVRRQP